MNWWRAFTVIDFETTGLGDYDRAIEMGLVRFEHGLEVESCNFVLCPMIDALQMLDLSPCEGLKVSGVTHEEIQAAPTFAEVWPTVADMFDGAVPLAYNAPFDRRFLQRELWCACSPQLPESRAQVAKFGFAWLDPFDFVKVMDRYASKSLLNACKRRGIEIVQAHRAIDDARAAGALWLEVAKECSLDGTYEDARSRQDKHRVEGALDYHKYKARKAGQAELAGDLYICDACFHTDLSKSAGQLPDDWCMFDDLAPEQRAKHYGSETIVACGLTCLTQFRTWSAGLA